MESLGAKLSYAYRRASNIVVSRRGGGEREKGRRGGGKLPTGCASFINKFEFSHSRKYFFKKKSQFINFEMQRLALFSEALDEPPVPFEKMPFRRCMMYRVIDSSDWLEGPRNGSCNGSWNGRAERESRRKRPLEGKEEEGDGKGVGAGGRSRSEGGRGEGGGGMSRYKGEEGEVRGERKVDVKEGGWGSISAWRRGGMQRREAMVGEASEGKKRREGGEEEEEEGGVEGMERLRTAALLCGVGPINVRNLHMWAHWNEKFLLPIIVNRLCFAEREGMDLLFLMADHRTGSSLSEQGVCLSLSVSNG